MDPKTPQETTTMSIQRDQYGPDGCAQTPPWTHRSDESPVKHGYTFARWLEAAGRQDSASEYDLRAAWDAGEDPAEYQT
jgi:hypothetical protein